MATKNLDNLKALSAKYNVAFQPLYSKKALEKGNLESVHQALIGGMKYTSLCTLNKADLEQIFINVSKGIHSSNMTKTSCKKNSKQGNTIKFNKDGETVYINGRKYNVFDVVKDWKIGALIYFLSEQKNDEVVERFVQYIQDNFERLFNYKLGVDYSQSAKNFAEYIRRDNLTPDDMLDDLIVDYQGSIRNYAIDIVATSENLEPTLENVKITEKALSEYIGA